VVQIHYPPQELLKEAMKIQISPPNSSSISLGAMWLKNGGLVAFPTETVYGIGAVAGNREAIDRLYSVKGRPNSHPVIVHIAEQQLVEYWAKEIPDYARSLMKEFWPGPMTLILRRTSHAANWITGGQDFVGLRIPSHPVALALLSELHKLGGRGVAAPSANRFGGVSPTSAQAVIEELGSFLSPGDVVIDGGDCEVGIESTIVDCTNDAPKVIRKGAITAEMISKVVAISEEESGIRASGTLPRHYSPRTTVIVNREARAGDGLLALASISTPVGVQRLASPSNIDEYAHDLYRAFRLGDSLQVSRIVVIPPEGEGLASAIRDRIMRAALHD
jgi:L-threonylcarbamoyladenylate synthase